MRLLDVRTFEFTEFHSPGIPKYAIASHRWKSGTEISLNDVEERKRVSSYGYQKVKGFAEYVRLHLPDVSWLWIDTCCIDQKNNTELSEAINSMFRWYRDAEVCLAYLHDVPGVEDASSFETSTWFGRGWTLQELIAPSVVIFLTQTWQVIGHKGASNGRSGIPMQTGALLNSQVAAITQIPEPILQDYKESSSFSIEEKLKWMGNRQTTREEDLSYCLLGILDVSMNIRYGDGKDKTRKRLLKKARSHDRDVGGPETLPKPSSNIPFRRDPDFVDRVTITNQIRAKLSVPAARAALVGLGGVGKSQLAIDYSRWLQQQLPQTWVFWIHASNLVRFEQSVRDAVNHLRIYRGKDPKADHLQLFRNWLRDESKGSWLIVLDNADDVAFLLQPLEPLATPAKAQVGQRRIDYIPSCDHGSMIITTRSKSEAHKLVYEKEVIHIKPMNGEEAEALLDSKLDGLGSQSDKRKLAVALDCMPLAITQASAYIREYAPRCSIQQYLEKIEQSRASRTSLLRSEIPLHDRDSEASNSILLTWQVSFEHIYNTRRSAAELLSLMSFCDRFAILESLMRADFEEVDSSCRVLLDFEADIVTLRNFSFIKVTTNVQIWEMHRLVQDATQIWLEDQGRFSEVLEQFVHRLCVSFPTGRFEDWRVCNTLFPHARCVADHKPTNRDALLEWATIMYKSAWYALEQGSLIDGLSMGICSMEVRLEQLGEENEATLASISLVAGGQGMKGQWKKAEKLIVRLMETSRTVFGAEHPHTLASMSNLASTYREQGRWRGAEELEVKVMEIRRTVFGTKHPSTLTCMANLASTYTNQGRWIEAEELEVKVMESSSSVLGTEHPDTLTSMSNLASTYMNQGRWTEAEKLGVKVIKTLKTVLGTEHPSTLTSMANLASTYMNQGRWIEAEELQVKVIETSKTVLGIEHPSTLMSMSNLASTYMNQGRWTEAEELEVKVMESLSLVLGTEHPSTLTSMANLASTYCDQGRWSEAKELMKETVEYSKSILGEEHPDTHARIFALRQLTAAKLAKDARSDGGRLDDCVHKIATIDK
ncbi:TPR-like protein [Polychaeton citri CBS 116435]|uniref:TPR-like protein n=1 Tax=Polychaeton citri CBS 116435 TaxID=1314669 RepID=A0A9P4Q0V6_9PEZI|nr:TPR-like protein [Polychaeton citri CBS 116435]